MADILAPEAFRFEVQGHRNQGPASQSRRLPERKPGPGDVRAPALLRGYSVLSACMGSTRDARHAGNRQATAATASSSPATAANTQGSSGCVS
jgi:hypothetical protein